MVPFEIDALVMPHKPKISVSLDPVPNILYSFSLLAQVDELSGLGEWVTRMARELPAERLHINKLVMIGMHYALAPEQSWPSFPAYLDNLAAMSPLSLRDRLLRNYLRHAQIEPSHQIEDRILSSSAAYLQFLRDYFPPEAVDEAIETATYQLVIDPPQMHALLLAHLREMWRLFEPEWERVKPMLQEAVAAFQRLDLSHLSANEAGALITGQELSDKWHKYLTDAEQVIFIPSAHIGPYLGKFGSQRIFWLIFGARTPASIRPVSAALSRSELQMRLDALNDDTRLQILWLLSQHEELCAQDIMNQLELSQSAASRHLRQLSATGYLSERRRSGEKCYSLSRTRVRDTFSALEQFLS